MNEDKSITLRCACGSEHLDVDLWVEEDDISESYLTISTRMPPYRWRRNRLGACWEILRGREHYFSEVVLQPVDVAALSEFFCGSD